MEQFRRMKALGPRGCLCEFSAQVPVSPSKSLVREGVAVEVFVGKGNSPPESSGRLCFLVGSEQAVPWLEEAILGVCAGSTVVVRSLDEEQVILSHVLVVQVVEKESQVSPMRLPGLSEGTAKVLKEAPSRKFKAGNKASDTQASGENSPDTEANSNAPAAPGSDVCMERAEAVRLAGNAILTNPESTPKKLRLAITHYNEALMWLERYQREVDNSFKIRVLLNIALALGKLKDHRLCIIYCDAVLELDPTCVKAYYRRGQACAMLFMWVRAERDLLHASNLSPSSREIARELKQVRKNAALFMHRSRKDFAETYGYRPEGPIYKAADAIQT